MPRQNPEKTLRESILMVGRAVQKIRKFKRNKKYVFTEQEMDFLQTLCIALFRGHKEAADVYACLVQRASGAEEIGSPSARAALPSLSSPTKPSPTKTS